MIRDNIIELLAKNKDLLARKWLQQIKDSKFAFTYRQMPDDELKNRCYDVYLKLMRWLEGEVPLTELGEFYVDLGKRRYLENFPLPEVLYGLHLEKKLLWYAMLEEGYFQGTLEVYQALNMLIKVFNFFDLASFYITRGYLEEMYIKMGKSEWIGPEVIKEFFPPHSFHFEFNPDLI